jgi:hypothetical protein
MMHCPKGLQTYQARGQRAFEAPGREARAHAIPRASFASGHEASDFEIKTQDKLDAGAAT